MQQKHVLMDGFTIHEKVPSLYEQFEKNEPSRSTSAEGQRKEFTGCAGWINTLIVSTLNYTHTYTNTLAVEFSCLRENSKVLRSALFMCSSGYMHCLGTWCKNMTVVIE